MIFALTAIFLAGCGPERPATEANVANEAGVEQPMGSSVKPAWAVAAGTDAFGAWAKLRIGDQTQVMRLIPAGSFHMGAERGFGQWPIHPVTISRPFWLADSEVTQGLWREVLGQNPSKFKDVNQPVERVSWIACLGFIKRLNDRASGLHAGFPTEAQWEYACRAGSVGDFSGDMPTVAWYDQNSEGHPHRVRTKRANAWGLYDMHGNVWEWCADWFGDYASWPLSDPVGPLAGEYRIYRGGNWYSSEGYARSSNRGRGQESYVGDNLGLRICAPADQTDMDTHLKPAEQRR